MKIAGIIAEYNPFHNGHAHHIAETRKKTGCDYCSYAYVCRFDKKSGSEYRMLKPLSDDEVFDKLREQYTGKEKETEE